MYKRQGLELEAVFVPNASTRFNFTGAINTSELDGYEDYDPRNPYGVSSVDLSTIGESQGVVFGMTDVGMIYRSLAVSYTHLRAHETSIKFEV